jgi:hypothetical protein
MSYVLPAARELAVSSKSQEVFTKGSSSGRGGTRPDPLVTYAGVRQMWPRAVPGINVVRKAYHAGEIQGEVNPSGEIYYRFSSFVKWLEKRVYAMSHKASKKP